MNREMEKIRADFHSASRIGFEVENLRANVECLRAEVSALNAELAAARAVVEAAKVSPCRHSSDLYGYACVVCEAIAAYDAATKETP
jgi:outer membrane murein-binding lipoprotein Lpp